MVLTLTTDEMIDQQEAFYYRNAILKRFSQASSDRFWEVSHNLESGSDFSFDGMKSLYASVKSRKHQAECNEILIEHNSGTETKHYPKVSTLTEKIENFRNYGEEIFDPDIPIGPTSLVIDRAKELVVDLVINNISPFRVTPSIEEGLCLVFGIDETLAYLELYNDGEIGIIAEDTVTKDTIINKDLAEDEIISTLLELFQ